MDMIEFRATVKNGKIEIPSEYRGRIKNRVRVIVMPEGETPERHNLIDELLAKPVKVQDFQPLKRDDLYE